MEKYSHPIERNLNKRYLQTGLFCSECGQAVDFLQIRCKCGCLIDWDNVEDKKEI